MAERGWFLDIVQECVNYELKLNRLTQELQLARQEIEQLKGGGKVSSLKKKLDSIRVSCKFCCCQIVGRIFSSPFWICC